MIHEIGVELQVALAAQGCPFLVVDGPEAAETVTYSRERIVIEHDENAGDSFGPARSVAKNPRHRMTRNVGAKITIYAQSPYAGGLEFEHRRRAEHVLDLVLVQLEKVILARKNGWTIKGGKFVQPADLEKSDSIGGAVYELSFSVERAVLAQTWAGASRPTATIGAGGITNRTDATLAHGPSDQTAETGCGA